MSPTNCQVAYISSELRSRLEQVSLFGKQRREATQQGVFLQGSIRSLGVRLDSTQQRLQNLRRDRDAKLAILESRRNSLIDAQGYYSAASSSGKNPSSGRSQSPPSPRQGRREDDNPKDLLPRSTSASCSAKRRVVDTDLQTLILCLRLRRRHMLKELLQIFPLNPRSIRGFRILPLEALKRQDLREKDAVATGLGFLAHFVVLVAKYLDIAPRGYRSLIGVGTSRCSFLDPFLLSRQQAVVSGEAARETEKCFYGGPLRGGGGQDEVEREWGTSGQRVSGGPSATSSSGGDPPSHAAGTRFSGASSSAKDEPRNNSAGRSGMVADHGNSSSASDLSELQVYTADSTSRVFFYPVRPVRGDSLRHKVTTMAEARKNGASGRHRVSGRETTTSGAHGGAMVSAGGGLARAGEGENHLPGGGVDVDMGGVTRTPGVAPSGGARGASWTLPCAHAPHRYTLWYNGAADREAFAKGVSLLMGALADLRYALSGGQMGPGTAGLLENVELLLAREFDARLIF